MLSNSAEEAIELLYFTPIWDKDLINGVQYEKIINKVQKFVLFNFKLKY
jgi:hypothetical protein